MLDGHDRPDDDGCESCPIGIDEAGHLCPKRDACEREAGEFTEAMQREHGLGDCLSEGAEFIRKHGPLPPSAYWLSRKDRR
jgi:hypothetical protein